MAEVEDVVAAMDMATSIIHTLDTMIDVLRAMARDDASTVEEQASRLHTNQCKKLKYNSKNKEAFRSEKPPCFVLLSNSIATRSRRGQEGDPNHAP